MKSRKRNKTTRVLCLLALPFISGLAMGREDSPPSDLLSTLQSEIDTSISRLPENDRHSLGEAFAEYERQLHDNWGQALSREPDELGPIARIQYTLQFLYGGRDNFNKLDTWTVFDQITDPSVIVKNADLKNTEASIAHAWFEQASLLIQNQPDLVARYSFDATKCALKYSRQVDYTRISAGDLEKEIIVLSFIINHSNADNALSWTRGRKLDQADWTVRADQGTPVDRGQASSVYEQAAMNLHNVFLEALQTNNSFRELQLEYLQNEIYSATTEIKSKLDAAASVDKEKVAEDCLNFVEGNVNKNKLEALVSDLKAQGSAKESASPLDNQEEGFDALKSIIAQPATKSDPGLFERLTVLMSLNGVLVGSMSNKDNSPSEKAIDKSLAELWLKSFQSIEQK